MLPLEILTFQSLRLFLVVSETKRVEEKCVSDIHCSPPFKQSLYTVASIYASMNTSAKVCILYHKERFGDLGTLFM